MSQKKKTVSESDRLEDLMERWAKSSGLELVIEKWEKRWKTVFSFRDAGWISYGNTRAECIQKAFWTVKFLSGMKTPEEIELWLQSIGR